ncbi:MAG: efflux RND transporter permease subunit, partial [Muribaculaceae bacterium]|nr:efflux RND transporter permease subunit [Muribaculaceae bacterium]
GGAISLDKLVEVSHSEARAKSHFRINGLNSIYVYITADELANQLELASAIERETERLRAAMPQGYSIEKSFDSTENIREELDRIYFRSGLTVLILLLFVGLVSLSIRYVALITISLAINLAVAAGFYYLAGIEIQLYSLAGITISLNLIIDNLIVMTDHFTRHRDRRAFTSILAATLTTIGALSVVFFLDDTTRLSL